MQSSSRKTIRKPDTHSIEIETPSIINITSQNVNSIQTCSAQGKDDLNVNEIEDTPNLKVHLDNSLRIDSSKADLKDQASRNSSVGKLRISNLRPTVNNQVGSSKPAETSGTQKEHNHLEYLSLMENIHDFLQQQKCSKCGFENSKLDSFEVGAEKHHHKKLIETETSAKVPGNGILLGSGLPNIIREVIYIKGNSKLD